MDIVFESVNIFTTGMMESISVVKPKQPAATTQGGSSSGSGSGATNPDVKDVGNSPFGGTEMIMFGTIGTILTGAVMVYVTSGSILLLNHVFLMILLSIGPIF